MSIRTVSLLVSVCIYTAVNADDSKNPCDETPGGRHVATPSFCQPAEEAGSYGVRYWTMPGDEMCNRIQNGHCFTLDDMECIGSPKWCLKWQRGPWGAYDAYAGRVTIPSGMRLSGWGSWSCGGRSRFSRVGPYNSGKQNVYDFWDFDWRVNAFKIELISGYRCVQGRIVPDGSGCKPANIIGRWAYWFSQQTNDTTTKKLTVGLSTTRTIEDESSYKFTFGEKVGGGFTIGEAKDCGESSYSWELSAEQSVGVRHSVVDSLSHDKVDEIDKTLTGSGVYWQFIMYANNSDSCPSERSRLYIPEFVHTPNIYLPPCCAPGNFIDIDDPTGDCIPNSPKICKHETGAVVV